MDILEEDILGYLREGGEYSDENDGYQGGHSSVHTERRTLKMFREVHS